MGSIVIFRISSCPPLFVVYQYHTCNWFYFSYFLLYVGIVTDLVEAGDIIGEDVFAAADFHGTVKYVVFNFVVVYELCDFGVFAFLKLHDRETVEAKILVLGKTG